MDMEQRLEDAIGHLVALELQDGDQISGLLVAGTEAANATGERYAIKTRRPVAEDWFDYIGISGPNAVRTLKTLEPDV